MSLCGVVGSGTLVIGVEQVGVFDGAGVALGGVDAETEQVADASGVAAGGVDFVQDAVFAQGLGSQVDGDPGVVRSDGVEAGCAAPVDEQVGVGGAGPGLGAV